jgi:hypothetical protein
MGVRKCPAMNSRYRVRRAFDLMCVGLLWLGLAASVSAGAAAPSIANPDPIPAGKFDLVAGDVQILTPGKAARTARQGDPVIEGDTLITGRDSETHLTMSDTGFLVLRANSRIQILRFKADGGDDDRGVIKLFVGSLRTVTGWIGKFNRRSYKLQTPTATIGIRGTDHETRYIPPGSSEGEPGTYDKVFFGETTIASDTGQTTVTADHAGYAANQGEQQPQVLPRIPGFFKPGPHEDLINRKHEEIQKMIVQRREQRRKIVEEKRAQLREAQREMQEQSASNQTAATARAVAVAEQNANTEQQLAAIRSRSEDLQKKSAAVQDMRKALQQRLVPALQRNPGLREQFKAVWATGSAIADEYKAIKDARQAINARNVAATEARKAAAEEQRKNSEALLADLKPEAEALKNKWQALAASREALEKQAGTLPPADLAKKRKALNATADALTEAQNQNTAGFDAVFDQNVSAAQARIDDEREQHRLALEQGAALNDREAAVEDRQRINEGKLEALQAQAIDKLGGDDGMRAQLADIHGALEAIHAERADIRIARGAMQARNEAANAQRQGEIQQQLDTLRDKHREVVNKRSDLQNEQKGMQEEIRSLFELEQKRYREELRTDRALQREE